MTGALTAGPGNPRGDGHYICLLSLADQICVASYLHWEVPKAARRWSADTTLQFCQRRCRVLVK